MHEYTVAQRSLDDGRLALVCNLGRCHLTRSLSTLPRVGVLLSGAKPHLGFGLLLCVSSGDIFPVVFELINCTQLEFSQDGTRKASQQTLRAFRGPSKPPRILSMSSGRRARPIPS